MSIINSQPRIGAAGQSTGFKIERSLRFNSADSAYLNRTPASDGNRKTWTLSTWVKISAFGSQVFILGAGVDGDNRTDIRIDSDSLQFINIVANTVNANLKTTQVFRDPSAWYHIVVAVDSTQATSTNRIKVYVNGSEVTAFSTSTYFSQNTDTFVNDNSGHTIGRYSISGANYFNGYMADVYLIDGSTPTTTTRTVGGVTETILTQFGEFDTDTGVWKPKAYPGSYGTNGFYLKFADNSGTTSTTLGKDSSGNGNNWTPNNFSVTAGAGNDSLVDTPTPYGTDTGSGGEVRGNYCTLNPLNNPASSTLTNGNLDVTTASSTGGRVVGTVGVSSGKWYWEITPTSVAGISLIGIAAASRVSSDGLGDFSDDYAYQNNGNKYSNSSATSYGASYTANDVIGVALDLDAGTLVFYKNNSSQGTAYSSISGTFVPAMSDGQNGGSSAFVCNFGQRPFAYTAPSGFKALCTQNLPTPTIGATATTRAGKYFNTVTYSGTGTNGNSITGVGFQPDFVWIKPRSVAASHYLVDAVRGLGTGDSMRALDTSSTASEYTTENDQLRSFNSDGFTLDDNTDASFYVNRSGDTYVGWNWKANGAGSTGHTQGSISSTASVNQTAGFSIVTYVGTGTAGTIGHGLGAVPSMIIVKRRTASTAQSWQVFHSGISGMKDGYIYLNSTAAFTSGYSGIWNGTNPTSTVFSVKDDNDTNASGGLGYVAYCFAPVAGYSAFGSYTGNGSADGPFVYTGFRPAWVLFKLSSASGIDWMVFDAKRNTYNAVNSRLFPSLSNAEADGAPCDFLSNGFKMRENNDYHNRSGATYVYAAFAENPFKYSLAR